MAGIKAISVSKTMADGDTAVDKSVSGYITAEGIVLTTFPTGTNYSWSQSKPTGATARSDLSGSSGASVRLVPDVEGIYLVTVVVDGVTSYVIRIACVHISAVSTLGALRYLSLQHSQVPAPSDGHVTFESSDAGGLVQKDSSARVVPLKPGIVGADLTDLDATLTVSQGVHRGIPLSTLTAPRAYTLGTAGATAGDIIEVHRYDVSAHAVTVINGGPGAGTLTTLAAAEKRSAEFRFDGTNWVLQARRRLA